MAWGPVEYFKKSLEGAVSKVALVFACTLATLVLKAQTDSTLFAPYTNFAQSETEFGVMPELKGFHPGAVGGNIGLGFSQHGEGGGSVYLTYVGFELAPGGHYFNQKVGVMAHKYAFFLGVNAGMEFIHFQNDGQEGWLLRPQIGIGLIRLFLNYGRNFYMEPGTNHLTKSSWTLSYFQPLFKLED